MVIAMKYSNSGSGKAALFFKIKNESTMLKKLPLMRYVITLGYIIAYSR